MTLIVAYVVVMRYVFSDTPVWGEEGVRLLLVWLTFMGASIGLKHDTHIRINAFDSILPPKVLRVLEWFSIVLLILFSVFMIIEGTKMALLSAGNRMPGLGIASSWLVASIPVAGIANIILLISKRWDKK